MGDHLGLQTIVDGGITKVFTGTLPHIWQVVPGIVVGHIAELQSRLGTEQAMHAAWRKRAEEAEAELNRLRTAQ